MSKQDEYKLNFGELKIDGIIYYHCTRWGEMEESYYLARLLDDCCYGEPPGLLEEVNNALNGEYYEEFFSLNASMLDVQIVPPNIIIDNTLVFPLSEMKPLLEEWIRFCKM